MYQAFLSLFWWILESIKRFCYFFGGFLNVSSVFVTFLVRRGPQTEDRGPGTGDRGPETGDRAPETGDRRPGTGDRGPETGDRRPGTGNRGPGAGRWEVIN